ncbi:MAG: imidazole glycerol phosphate synthase subunit HisH [Defluviitaleaceae bacterium]|nr:imidazole glycerol phosphate synthase subunit HisH [Defluviitaleaceae bacterium]
MIRVIDYKAGNAPSVMHAINRLGFKAQFACNASELEDASHIILPGVGSARATMDSLKEMDLMETLEAMVLHKKVFFLGICVGMQILFEYSEEENATCLGWLKGSVVKFDSSDIRVPQMGWNKVELTQSPINTPCSDYFYFVNSYYAVPLDNADIWGTANYGGTFTASVHRENIYATQFHIEKSGEAGLALLGGFLQC